MRDDPRIIYNMKYEDYLVDLVDESGAVVGQKPRREIDKQRDLYHAAHTLLITAHGEPVLATIPARIDLPNLYANLRGTTVATIRRTDESATSAAARSVVRELHLSGVALHHLGERFFKAEHGPSVYMSGFFVVHDLPETHSIYDIAGLTPVDPDELRRQLRDHPEKFALTFHYFWRAFHGRLPLKSR